MSLAQSENHLTSSSHFKSNLNQLETLSLLILLQWYNSSHCYCHSVLTHPVTSLMEVVSTHMTTRPQPHPAVKCSVSVQWNTAFQPGIKLLCQKKKKKRQKKLQKIFSLWMGGLIKILLPIFTWVCAMSSRDSPGIALESVLKLILNLSSHQTQQNADLTAFHYCWF